MNWSNHEVPSVTINQDLLTDVNEFEDSVCNQFPVRKHRKVPRNLI
jgi:hypothetical protein